MSFAPSCKTMVAGMTPKSNHPARVGPPDRFHRWRSSGLNARIEGRNLGREIVIEANVMGSVPLCC